MRTRSILIASNIFLLNVLADDSSSSSSSSSTSSTATTGIPATSTHDIKVGSNGLSMEPDSLVASPGDLLNFHFYASGHSIAQSSFDKPCEPIDNGIFSGFFNGGSGKEEDGKVFSMRLNDTSPLWLYCSKDEHCKAGQSMVINAPSGSDQTLKAYKDKAKKVEEPKSPSNVNGGVVRDKSTSTSSSSSPSSTKKSAAGALQVGSAARTVGLFAGVASAMMLL